MLFLDNSLCTLPLRQRIAFGLYIIGAVLSFAMAYNMCLAWNSPLEFRVLTYFDMQLVRAERTFDVAKTIIGVLSLAQSIEVGVSLLGMSASFEPFQLLEPLDIFARNIADILMWIIGSLFVQKKIFAILFFVACAFFLWPGFLCMAIAQCKPTQSIWKSIAKKMLLPGLSLALCIPLMVEFSIVLENVFLTKDAHSSIQSLEQSEKIIKDIVGDIDSFKEKVVKYVTHSKEIINELRKAIGSTTRAFLRILGILSLTTFVFPPLFFMLLWCSVSWAYKSK